jgi:hypothetical protein
VRRPQRGGPSQECDAHSEAVRVILSTITGITIQACIMYILFLHTLSLGRNRRRKHLVWRGLRQWRGSPGEECDVDSEAVRVILPTIAAITIQLQACMHSFCTKQLDFKTIFKLANTLASLLYSMLSNTPASLLQSPARRQLRRGLGRR